MTFFGWIFTGLLVGCIARLLMPGRQPMGCLMTIACGIAGSLAGSGIYYAIWGLPDQQFAWNSWPGYPLAIIGSLLVLWVVGATQRQPPA